MAAVESKNFCPRRRSVSTGVEVVVVVIHKQVVGVENVVIVGAKRIQVTVFQAAECTFRCGEETAVHQAVEIFVVVNHIIGNVGGIGGMVGRRDGEFIVKRLKFGGFSFHGPFQIGIFHEVQNGFRFVEIFIHIVDSHAGGVGDVHFPGVVCIKEGVDFIQKSVVEIVVSVGLSVNFIDQNKARGEIIIFIILGGHVFPKFLAKALGVIGSGKNGGGLSGEVRTFFDRESHGVHGSVVESVSVIDFVITAEIRLVTVGVVIGNAGFKVVGLVLQIFDLLVYVVDEIRVAVERARCVSGGSAPVVAQAGVVVSYFRILRTKRPFPEFLTAR